jgi:hypothetical protein
MVEYLMTIGSLHQAEKNLDPYAGSQSVSTPEHSLVRYALASQYSSYILSDDFDDLVKRTASYMRDRRWEGGTQQGKTRFFVELLSIEKNTEGKTRLEDLKDLPTEWVLKLCGLIADDQK